VALAVARAIVVEVEVVVVLVSVVVVVAAMGNVTVAMVSAITTVVAAAVAATVAAVAATVAAATSRPKTSDLGPSRGRLCAQISSTKDVPFLFPFMFSTFRQSGLLPRVFLCLFA